MSYAALAEHWVLSQNQNRTESVPLPSGDAESARVASLVRQAQGGCGESFDLLVGHYVKRIYNYLYKIIGNRHDAEDLTQETFIKVYKGLGRYREAHSFTPWIYTIARRTALNHLRGRKSMVSFSDDYHQEIDLEDPAVLLEKAESLKAFQAMTRSLKPNQREMLWLRYGEGFSVKEIARIMKKNAVSVRVQLHRARQHLARPMLRNKPDSERP